MSRTTGTTVRGIRIPIVKQGDDLVNMVVKSVLAAAEAEGFALKDRDVIGVTESVLARAQGNYITLDGIAQEVEHKFGGETFGIVFPILSRNRFSIILKGLARGAQKVIMLLSYPCDEVGNHLMDTDKMDQLGLNSSADVLTEKEYRKMFGDDVKHPFTGIDYIQMYREIVQSEGADLEVLLGNDPRIILQYTKKILTADVHNRARTKRILRQAGAEVIFGLDDICTVAVNGSGYNEQYGLLGSNKSTEEQIKLFPREGAVFVQTVQDKLKAVTGKTVEVMIYGDGAFKDPVGKIWELADPVVSPAFTSGLWGLPNELKLKYFADNQLKDLTGESCQEEMKKYIRSKKQNLVGSMDSQGTTPRQLTDLLGSLCDLTSGSGDKGTPVVLIQGYFDNYACE